MTGAADQCEGAVDELREADLLAHGELVPTGDRAPDGESATVPIPVRCGRPLLYPVPVRDLPAYLRRRAEATGGSYVGALFAFDLDALPRGSGTRPRTSR